MRVRARSYKQGGITNIYRGFWATMGRDCAASFFYFSTYELLKYHLNPRDGTPPGVLPTLFAGGCAGIMNWAGEKRALRCRSLLTCLPSRMPPD